MTTHLESVSAIFPTPKFVLKTVARRARLSEKSHEATVPLLELSPRRRELA
ncbi:hypothetical protein DEO72_LG3g1893 [Vigna unguiculata]|uniref:Uncharacterized protein n=1 Tax=Vigna unguiculata TaxID=3917 RepID=A0A4D6LFC9_VIGUN|nr:hypothetical protein DEO72_LG3g1893 [Vigna unguiculata]